MNIVAYVHLYVPNHNAGAEVMLHEILLDLMKFGHKATVICQAPSVKKYQGVEIVNIEETHIVNKKIKEANIIFTHLDFTQQAISLSKKYKKPIVHLIHNDNQINYHNITAKNSDLIIANSKWIYNTIKINTKKVIVYPPIRIENYKINNINAKSVTLINMNKNKGVETFWKLARNMPNQDFIGVEGGYSKQFLDEDFLNNVSIYEHTPNIKAIYEMTKILIVPSAYESWGRVGMEAFASGIPVIAHPTPGLKESLGEAGIFIDRDNIEGYIEKINLLNNKQIYEEYQNKALLRVQEVQEEYKEQIIVLNNKLLEIIQNYNEIN